MKNILLLLTLAINISANAQQKITLKSGSGSSTGGANSLSTYIVRTSTGAPTNAQILSSLTTGIVKNTTGTGTLSIATAGDFPTLNQNTTGSAATLTTGRTFTLTGDADGTSSAFNGSTNVSISVAIAASTVTGKALTGYSVGSNSEISATDNILEAFGKAQAQINDLNTTANLYVEWPLKFRNDTTAGIDKADLTHDGYLDSLDYARMFTRQTNSDPSGTFTINVDAGGQIGISFTSTGARTIAFSNIRSGDIIKLSINNTSGSSITLTLPSNSFVAGTGTATTVTIPIGRSMLTVSDYDGTNYQWVQQSY